MSEELVPTSSNEYLDQLVTTVSKQIADGKIEIDEEKRARKIEKAINDHYVQIASETLNMLWKTCKKQTGHRQVEKAGWPVCRYCAKPLGYGFNHKERKKNAERKEREGIENIAGQLRYADVKAGVEWKPNWIK